MPAISVIVPIYNVENYLSCCIDSILNQTFKDFELILVDDGSTDKSSLICDDYANQDSRIIVIHKINSGQGLARNDGLKIAKGEYVTFVDSDDYIELNALEILYKSIKNDDLDLLRYCSNRFVTEGVFSYVEDSTEVSIYDNDQIVRKIRAWLFGYNPKQKENRIFTGGSVCMELIRLSLIHHNNISFQSERIFYSEDYLFTYSCLGYAHKIGYMYTTLYHYRITSNSFSTLPKLNGVDRLLFYVGHLQNMLLKDGYGDDAYIYSRTYFINEYRSQVKGILQSGLTIRDKYSWFKSNTSLPILKDIVLNYPVANLLLFHKSFFYLCYYKLFVLVFLVCNIAKIKILFSMQRK